MMKIVDQYDRTGEKFLEEIFEFENCEECNKGKKDHMPVVVLGNWFALCEADYEI